MSQAIDPNARYSKIVGQISGTLWLEPNGVYRLDGWVVPVRDDPALRVNNSQPVGSSHGPQDDVVGLAGSVLGVNVPN
ncbi:hypothetical protein P9A16_31650 [Shinella sp. 838]|uniref:hypothetical protein n=1 Tax=Shinella sp. 838 TaxID=3038164 RepID=UPI002414D487|nr:hypothetical protein [Shinella sp. 838]MDG4675657.1 hypothetical protein [Shinella sp. 838]